MRQRLSSEPDRYRGRRRVPTPPRSRYAVVVTGPSSAPAWSPSAPARPAGRQGRRPQVLADLRRPPTVDNGLAKSARDRAPTRPPAVRAHRRDGDLAAESPRTSGCSRSPTTPSPPRTGSSAASCTPGIDLAAPEGTPYKAVHAGVVKESRLDRRLRAMAVIIDHGDGTEIIYGHARQLLVQKGRDRSRRGSRSAWSAHRPRVRVAPAPRDTGQRRVDGPDPVFRSSTEWTSSYKSRQSTS